MRIGRGIRLVLKESDVAINEANTGADSSSYFIHGFFTNVATVISFNGMVQEF